MSLYIQQSLPYKLRNDLSIFTEDLESIFLEITLPRSQPIVVGCIYRPPNTNLVAFISSLNASLHSIRQEKKPCYLAGDFNVDLLKAESHVPSTEFLELLYSHFIRHSLHFTPDFVICMNRVSLLKPLLLIRVG